MARNIRIAEDTAVIPIVVKELETELIETSDPYQRIVNRAVHEPLTVLSAASRFLFVPHNLSILSYGSDRSHKDAIRKLINFDRSIFSRGIGLIVVKILITILHILLVVFSCVWLWSVRRSWFAVFIFGCITYGLIGSIGFGLLQHVGIVGVEPIGRFFFPYLSFIMIIAASAIESISRKQFKIPFRTRL